MHHLFKITCQLLVVISLAFGFSRCSDDDPVNIGIVTLQPSSTLGDILVDGNGKSLYVFTKDVAGQSNAPGVVLPTWPIYYATDLSPELESM